MNAEIEGCGNGMLEVVRCLSASKPGLWKERDVSANQPEDEGGRCRVSKLSAG